LGDRKLLAAKIKAYAGD